VVFCWLWPYIRCVFYQNWTKTMPLSGGTEMGWHALYHGLPSWRYFVLLYLPMSGSKAEATMLTWYLCLVINCSEQKAGASTGQHFSVICMDSIYGASTRFHVIHQFETVTQIFQSVRVETPRCLLFVTKVTGDDFPQFRSLGRSSGT
jgi:hypothetical protein